MDSVARGRIKLGNRLRRIRKGSGRTLVDLAALTGLSRPTISRIENGAIAVSYDNLLRLSAGLGVELAELFCQPALEVRSGRRAVTRAHTGPTFETPQYEFEVLASDLQPRQMFPIFATLKSSDLPKTGDMTTHNGEEFLYVLSGKVVVYSDCFKPLHLAAGDSVYFDSGMKHAVASVGDADARVLWIATHMRSELATLTARAS